MSYLLMPLLAWLVAGSLKFVVNSAVERRLAFDRIGYGGMPSTHSAITGGTVALIALNEGLSHPALGVAATLALIVALDAHGLRRQLGRHAERLNRVSADAPALRERMGHTWPQILAGWLTGGVAAIGLHGGLTAWYGA